jgi:ankyrin repeat protein
MMGHTEAVRVLIAAGADVNARGDGGYTALMDASGRGREEIARLLKEAGATG